jgi:hypothetical protein
VPVFTEAQRIGAGRTDSKRMDAAVSDTGKIAIEQLTALLRTVFFLQTEWKTLDLSGSAISSIVKSCW